MLELAGNQGTQPCHGRINGFAKLGRSYVVNISTFPVCIITEMNQYERKGHTAESRKYRKERYVLPIEIREQLTAPVRIAGRKRCKVKDDRTLS